MGNIIPISPLIWKNFSRDSQHLEKEFLEYVLDVPVYTTEEFEAKQHETLEDIFSSLKQYKHITVMRYSPTSDINLEFGKCNLLYHMYSLDVKPRYVRDFSIISRPRNPIALLGNIYF